VRLYNLFLTRNIANARALKMSAVGSGVVLRLYSVLLDTKHCACKRIYTLCCREWPIVESILSAAKHEILRMHDHLHSLL
jgi:hypothetical protein